jgi:hypothetical protein
MTINQTDFITPITGNVVIYNNSASITLQANSDVNTVREFDETFKLVLRRSSNVGPIVKSSEPILLRETSNIKVYSSLVSNLPAEAMADTANVTFTLRTINVSPGDTLYYYTTGNVTSSNFVGGNTGTFNVGLIEDGTGIANIVLTAADIPANTTAVFQLNIAETPLGTPNIISNTVVILDLALTQLAATGGSIVTTGGFRTHTFTTSGTFLVTQTGLNPTPVSYLVVAGGGGGGASPPATGAGGGGGAGGFRPLTTTIPNAVSPNTPYTITVGGGGAAGSTSAGGNGGPSSAFGTTSTGGGGGGGGGGTILGQPGGSGGGFGRRTPGQSSGGGTPGQGNPGSTYALYPGLPRWSGSGGGGGAGGPGENPPAPPVPNVLTRGHSGGPGALWPGNGGTYSGGGAGGSGDYPTPPATAPAVPGGGAAGGAQSAPGNAAPANTGGGGSGAGWAPLNTRTGGAGGSGIVVIRYPFT